MDKETFHPSLFLHDLGCFLPHVASASLVTIGSRQANGHGNKWFKLALNVQQCIDQRHDSLLTFGGAYSNHIAAVAEVCANHGIQSIGVIRGENTAVSNPTLGKATKLGMRLVFVDRQHYRLRHDPNWLRSFLSQYPNTYLLPEGGTNSLAVLGCQKIAEMLNTLVPQPHHMITAVGSGGTLAGLMAGIESGQHVSGYAVVKDLSLANKIGDLLGEPGISCAEVSLKDASFGGYAKINKTLLEFIVSFHEQTSILLDPVYTSKMLMSVKQDCEKRLYKDQHLVLLHTGGLQGWFGMQNRVENLGFRQFWSDVIVPYLSVESDHVD